MIQQNPTLKGNISAFIRDFTINGMIKYSMTCISWQASRST